MIFTETIFGNLSHDLAETSLTDTYTSNTHFNTINPIGHEMVNFVVENEKVRKQAIHLTRLKSQNTIRTTL
jgi:hypothetical protein